MSQAQWSVGFSPQLALHPRGITWKISTEIFVAPLSTKRLWKA